MRPFSSQENGQDDLGSELHLQGNALVGNCLPVQTKIILQGAGIARMMEGLPIPGSFSCTFVFFV